jgi:hypothetical protein
LAWGIKEVRYGVSESEMGREHARCFACDYCSPDRILHGVPDRLHLAFIGAAVLYLPLFVFLPKLIQRATRADTDAVIEAFGKNEQVKKVFWTVFISKAGLVLARVVDPATAQQIVGLITGMGGEMDFSYL